MDMKERLYNRISELTSIIGVSGDEWDVAHYVHDALKPYVDDMKVLNNGTVIAIKKGSTPGQKKILTGHMDEVGYRVKRIDNNGFAYFDAIGSPTTACLPGRRMLIKGRKGTVSGVVGVRAAHLLTEEQKKKAQTVTESYLDLCVSDKKEAEELGVYVGASIVPESPCTRMPQNPDYVVTRAADCRVLLAVIIETMIDLKPEDIKGEVAAVFTILEESTVKAIATPANYYQPDYGMFLDTIPCGDVPDVDINELPVGLGKGPVLIQSQTLAAAHLHNTSHPKLMEAVETIAQSECIQVQPVAFNGAGYSTDAVGAMLSGTGMVTVTLACPRRYSHSPVEIFNLNDVVMTQQIVSAFAKLDVDLKMF